MKRLLPFICLIFMACPPPHYPILIGHDGKWRKYVKIEEDSLKVKIKGHITLSGWEDDFAIDIDIEGMDTSRIVFYDTTNFYGRRVSRTHYFDDKIIFESENFSLPPRSGVFLQRNNTLFINKNKVTIAIWANYDNHKIYDEMTKDEFLSYLDGLTARIRIENIFAEPKLVEVKVDKELLARKLKGWVPALREKN
ncbi:MAG: hypothetical protein A2W25_06935 [candidate division Zixibacteria bacterium RBG_16_53_22]|nr:MAG: hypothetical protein A2W25_06935 [candidate division Zixibacteria bacterium RBG_16_53_22]